MIGVTQLTRRGVLSPAELAAAMRDGLESRRIAQVSPAPVEAPVTTDPTAGLWPLVGLIGHPVPFKPGMKGKALRLARRVVKKLLGPWLDHQTRFNHALTTALQTQFTEVGRQL